MTGIEVYDKYIALKTHFNVDKYNYLKYNGSTKERTGIAYLKRQDKNIFDAFARKYPKSDISGMFISHFIENKKFWIGDYNPKTYLEWKGRLNSLEYTFTRDINNIFSKISFKKDIKQLFINDGQHPPILEMLLNKEISIESFSILNSLFPFFDTISKNIEIPIIWNERKKICLKYEILLDYDKVKFKNILLSKIKTLL